MLTVDYGRLRLGRGDRVLDVGCGAGRHAFEAYRRGADVVAFDLDHEELRDVAGMCGAMRAEGQAPRRGGQRGRVRGRHRHAVRRRVVRPGHRGRGVRAHPGRPAGHGRGRPGAEARRHRRRHRAALAARADLLGPVPRVPRGAGRPRAHLHAAGAGGQAAAGRLGDHRPSSRARPARALLVAEVRGRRGQRRSSAGAGLPPHAGLGHHAPARRDAAGRARAQPAHRQERDRLRHQAAAERGLWWPRPPRPDAEGAAGQKTHAAA